MSLSILVTGDPICDHNYYRGNRATADSAESRGFRFTRTPGGALLLKGLIEEATKSLGCKTEFGLKVNYEQLPQEYHAFCLWDPQVNNPWEKDVRKHTQVWRAVEPPLGYGHPDSPSPRERQAALGTAITFPKPDILVVDDAGLGFRELSSRQRWPFPQDAQDFCPRWVVLKLTGAVGEGALWHELTTRCPNNLIVIVSADHLRRMNVRISRAQSWEATVQDLLAEMEDNEALATLCAARHLIVTFQSDGAFWIDRAKAGQPSSMLVFDAGNAEGEWGTAQGQGASFGYLSCFTAAVVRELCLEQSAGKNPDEPDLEAALIAGLGAGRELRRIGHGEVKVKADDKWTDNPAPGFPFDRIAQKIVSPSDKFVSAPLPKGRMQRGQWMMLDEWQVHARQHDRARPHYEAALAVAVLGPDALERLPVASFGDLLTVDRPEIESLRSLRQIIEAYERGGKRKKPLSIGVFGPPGAGKSFGVTQIAKSVFGEKVDVLTFNLSQFNDADDLNGAFHQVRDKALAGTTPVVFWDEFDSQGYRWLQYLLAPMQDGAFQDGQLSHPIGKCVFIFAGATSATFEQFGPLNPNRMDKARLKRLKKDSPDRVRQLENDWRDFVLKKGPDFQSRLAGFLNVLGPNPRQVCVETDGDREWENDACDLCYPIRRAFFIRSQFKLKPGQRLCMDSGLVRALLEIPHYKSGARSLEFLCERLNGEQPRRSQVPGPHLLGMHVEADEFWSICERDQHYLSAAPAIASALHEAYRLRIKHRKDKAHLDVPLNELSEDYRAANIAQALRIPDNLRLVNLQLQQGPVVPLDKLVANRNDSEKAIRDQLAVPDTLELLAEAEHNGWMVERMLNGWKYARQSDERRELHSLLIPYSQLSEDDKDYDRGTIIGKEAPTGEPHKEQFGYVDIVKTAGYRVVPVPPTVPIQ